MSKYNIEGGVDFFAELYKSLDVEESEEKTEEDKNKCLITNQELTDKHVTMDCGHKFNYIPLYNDIMNHKKKFNNMEGTHSKLNANEIRCPYCRKKQKHLLPYYEELGLAKVNGVNFYYNDTKHYDTTSKCEYQYPNLNYDPFTPESDTNSKYIPDKCCYFNGSKILVYDINLPEPITYGDDKHYCYKHKKEMIKLYKLQQKEKDKEEKKQAKIVEKQNKLLEKQNAKAKEKEEKQKAKVMKKNLAAENIVLGPSNVVIQSGCVHILKMGPNKGNPCGCKIIAGNMCKRHYLMNEKVLIINN